MFLYLHYVFVLCRHLLVNPKERRVVIVESILSSTTSFRSTLAEVLFKYFEVSFYVSLQLLRKFQMLEFIICHFLCSCDYFYEYMHVIHDTGIKKLMQWEQHPSLRGQWVHEESMSTCSAGMLISWSWWVSSGLQSRLSLHQVPACCSVLSESLSHKHMSWMMQQSLPFVLQHTAISDI